MFNDGAPNSSLQFRSYLVEEIVSSDAGNRFFDFPGFNGQLCKNYTFSFKINPDLDELIKMSEEFSSSIISKLGYTRRASEIRNDISDRKDISNAFVYSYIKTIVYAEIYSKSKSMLLPNHNLVFGGHKVLYDMIRLNYVNWFDSVHDVQVEAFINIPKGLTEQFKKSENPVIKDIFVNSFDEENSKFFSSKYERILAILMQNYKFMDIVELDKNKSYTPNLIPLGNSAWDPSTTKINYLPTQKLAMDPCSMCWGIACFVTLDEETVVDSDDRFYNDYSGRLNPRVRGHMIQAITNYNIYSNVNGSSMNSSNSGGGNPNSPRPSNNNDNNSGEDENNSQTQTRPNPNPDSGSGGGSLGGGTFPLFGRSQNPRSSTALAATSNDISESPEDKVGILTKFGRFVKGVGNAVDRLTSQDMLDKANNVYDLYRKMTDRGLTYEEMLTLSRAANTPLDISKKEWEDTVRIGPVYEGTRRRIEYNAE